jgi:uncharacterized protein YodC (DUF2158 family)
MAELKPGDVVELKSGGPDMTVARIRGNEVDCDWFIDGKAFRGTYPKEALKPATPPPA